MKRVGIKISMEDVPILMNIDMDNRRELSGELIKIVEDMSCISVNKLERYIIDFIRDNIMLDMVYDYDIIINNENRTDIYKLDRYNIIGKRVESKMDFKIEIDNNYISKEHLLIFVDRSGKLVMIDLNSTYGIYRLKKKFNDNSVIRMKLIPHSMYIVKMRQLYQISNGLTIQFVRSNTINNREHEINSIINVGDMSPLSYQTICNTKLNSFFHKMDKYENKGDNIQIRRLSFDESNNKEYIIKEDNGDELLENNFSYNYNEGMSRYQCEFDFEYNA